MFRLEKSGLKSIPLELRQKKYMLHSKKGIKNIKANKKAIRTK